MDIKSLAAVFLLVCATLFSGCTPMPVAQSAATSRAILITNTNNTNTLQFPQPSSLSSSKPDRPSRIPEPIPHPSSMRAESDWAQHPNFHLLPSLNECGYIQPEPSRPSARNGHSRVKRVVNGVPAGFGNYPWMAQIMQRNTTTNYQQNLCGGTIINNMTILTAAHCTVDLDTGYALTHVVLGHYVNADRRFQYQRSQYFGNCGGRKGSKTCSNAFLAEIDEIVVHEDYISGNSANDVALIRLKEDISTLRSNVYSLDSNEDQDELRNQRPAGSVPVPRLSAHPNWKLLPSRSICGFPIEPTHTQKNESSSLSLSRRKRLAGGRIALPGELPGIALINIRDYEVADANYVGGTGVLISSRYVLTTASFIRAKQLKGYSLHLVGFRTNKQSDTQYNFRIEKVIFHEAFMSGTYTNDIALLRLAKEVDFPSETNPICLPSNDDRQNIDGLKQEWSSCVDSNLIGAGYGRTKETFNSLPVYPNYIEMKARPNEHCDRVHSRNLGKMGPEKLCVSSCLGESTGLCGTTDEGGPLMNSVEQVDGRKQYTLFGLSSYFHECGVQSLPTLYTNVVHYVPWILDNIRP